MRKAIATMLGLALAAPAAAEPLPFDAASRKLEPAPRGHTPGKDDGPGVGTHNAGEDCGICHRPGGKAANYVFTVGGTLYEDRAARRPLRGGEVILEDIDGHVVSMTSNAVGNFWTYAPLASNGHAVASHGGVTEELFHYDDQGVFVPADPADARTWQYKAWVRAGDAVRAMVTIAPVGGSTDPTSRMGCSMHHAAMGSRGGLWGTGRSTLGRAPQAQVSLRRHVLPILVSKCVPCHVPGATETRLVTESDLAPTGATTVDFSAGRDYTSYAGSTYTVSVGGVSTTITKPGIRDVVDPAHPDESLLLVKTRRQPDDGRPLSHAGGSFWAEGDLDYEAIRRWIAEGALDN
jgi:hypothetical protein